MQVRKWMTRSVVTIGPQDSLSRARHLLEEHRIDQLPVVVEGKLVGLLTLRDLQNAFESVCEVAGRSPGAGPFGQLTVDAVMTPHVLTVQPDDSILYAAHLLRRERIGCLPVVEGSRLVGIITRRDLLFAFMQSFEAGSGKNSAPEAEPYAEAPRV
ncbi:Inosine-5'-monophosphate dehydrogenase [bacterium HR30]|nr:Inosine-5'-monophosphate dehydrogenase [bacterium HR30]